MPRFIRTARAEDDLIEIWLNIAPDNETAANARLDRIDRVCDSLATFPELGPARNDLAPELRHMVIGRYLILYRIIPDGGEIVRVAHDASHLPDLI